MTTDSKRLPILWIDNDACPRRVREVIYKAAERLQIKVMIVGNSYMKPPGGFPCEIIVVGSEFDAADNYIAENVIANDLVITSDVPLADRVCTASAVAISHKGDVFDGASIKEKLAIRNLSNELRSGGSISGGPPAFSDHDLKKFAASFDRHMQKLKNLLSSN